MTDAPQDPANPEPQDTPAANDAAATEAAAANAGAAEPATATNESVPAPPVSKTADDVEMLLRQAEEAIASVDVDPSGLPPGTAVFQFQELGGTPPTTEKASLELLRDVELNLTIELGRTHMQLEDVLQLRKGSVVPLEKLAGDPVDVYVNGRLVARGEVLVLNDNFCVRVAELVSGHEVDTT